MLLGVVDADTIESFILDTVEESEAITSDAVSRDGQHCELDHLLLRNGSTKPT